MSLKSCRDVEQVVKKELTFANVDNNQLFINYYGNLCQKVNSTTYNVIANKNNTLSALVGVNQKSTQTIIKILSDVVNLYWD